MTKEIKIQASLDPHHKCISVDGDGAASIKFVVDATQLAPVLTSLAEFKGKLIELTLKPSKQPLQEPDSETKKPSVKKRRYRG